MSALDVQAIRKDFPIYDTFADKPFVFLDSAASSQKRLGSGGVR